jgi:hypothetical protein
MSSEKTEEPKAGLENDFASRLSFPEGDQKPDTDKPAAKEEEASGVGDAQADGPFNAPGGHIMPEPEYDVQVTLADMQADPDNPLFSVKSFNQLELYVTPDPR